MRSAFQKYQQLLQQYLGSQRKAVLLMTSFLLLSIGLQLAGPQVVRWFIDAVQTGASEPVLIRLALLFISVTLVQQGVRVLATYWSERVAWTATNALRADLAAHLVRLDLSFHHSHTPGGLIERVDGDVNVLAGFFSSFVVELVGNLLLLLGIVVTAYWIDLRLGLAFTAFIIFTIGLLGWVRRGGTPFWQAEREHSAAFYGYLGEILNATEDIRSSNAVPYILRRFLLHLRAWWPDRRRAGFWGQSVMNAAIVAFAVGDAIAFGLGGRLYQSDIISLGTVYMIIAYVAMLAGPIETIRTQLQDFQRADASIVRVQGLLDIQSKLVDGPAELPSGPLSIVFQAVNFAYTDADEVDDPQPQVLHDLNFALKAERVLGLLGRTGSGKTTIARLLFRLYDPQSGEIQLNGIGLQQISLTSLRARIGLVTQDVQLFQASLRDNLTFFDETVSDEQLLTVLNTLGLRPWLARLPHGLDTLISATMLSAGEAQLLAFARVFLKDPGLLILDEASSRLDPATETLLEGALNTLLAGRTAIIIAHRLATLDRVDDILMLEDGQILEQGRRDVLAANPHSYFSQLRQGRL